MVKLGAQNEEKVTCDSGSTQEVFTKPKTSMRDPIWNPSYEMAGADDEQNSVRLYKKLQRLVKCNRCVIALSVVLALALVGTLVALIVLLPRRFEYDGSKFDNSPTSIANPSSLTNTGVSNNKNEGNFASFN